MNGAEEAWTRKKRGGGQGSRDLNEDARGANRGV